MAKLLHLTLQNYRNITSADLSFNGQDCKIVGANRVGKTNVIESICYLLTDKLLGGSSDIPSIKPQRDSRLKVVVEGTFLTNEGEVVLRKEFSEKWVRPRGSVNEEFQGHTTDYYVNGAKQARTKDFTDLLEKKFGMPTELKKLDVLQFCIDPFYLGDTICGSKDWKLAREIVIEIVGDAKPEEIFEFNGLISVAKADLEAHQYDDAEAKKAIRGEIDGYKKAIIANNGLIQEYSLVEDVEDEEYEKAKARDEEIRDQIANIRAGVSNPYAEEVVKLQNELFALQNQYQKSAMAVVDHSQSEAIMAQLREKQRKLNDLAFQSASEKSRKSVLRSEIAEMSTKQEAYKKTLLALKESFMSVMVEDICPTCGQPLPQEKIEEAVNIKKAEINANAQQVREFAKKNKEGIELRQAELASIEATSHIGEVEELENQIKKLKSDYDMAVAHENESVSKPDPKIAERISEINARLAEIHEKIQLGNLEVNVEVSKLAERRDALNAVRDKRVAYRHAQTRLKELNEANATIGSKQAEAEQRLWAVGEFVKTKLAILDQHMANRLGEVRFQLVKENIKAGSYDEVCTPYIISPATGKHTDTLFQDGSMSERIYTGCEIIKTIRNAFGWKPLPILFDQGGELDGVSVDKVANVAEAQIISVKVEGLEKVPTVKPLLD